MARRMATRRVAKAEAEVYLEKAEQFFRSMKDAQENEDWDAVGLNAIHCVISSNDALLEFRHGIRSASGSHADAVELLGKRKGIDKRIGIICFHGNDNIDVVSRARGPLEARSDCAGHHVVNTSVLESPGESA